ncbi:MAG: hypothetical protein QE271_14000 [Bacteriovoracaceae bacterium]|nr:hypothetical protein [Bacteriovoracaceae bacterium]
MSMNTVALDYSPELIISKLQINNKTIYSVRDDLLIGGTKQRAAVPYINNLIQQGVKHFIYASPFSGFAQVALAYSCELLEVECTLFCERDTEKNQIHEFSKLAEKYGAKIILCDNLSQASIYSMIYGDQSSHCKVIPLGFNDPEFKKLLAHEIGRQWKVVVKHYDIKELWLPIGSGTLLNVFKEVLGKEVNIHGVNVNVLPNSDKRIESILSDKDVIYYECKQKFHDPCLRELPIPSNKYYDAKLFSYLESYACEGAFWWNVAR